MSIYKAEIDMDHNSRSCKIILVIVMFSVDTRLAATFQSCSLSQGGMDCAVGKETCCLCRQNVTKRNLHASPDLFIHGVNNTTTKCKVKLNKDCKLIICPLMNEQNEESASMELNNLLCINKRTAGARTCNVCCTVVESSDAYNSIESAHALSESAKVAIICSAFGFIVVLFVVYMSYRRRADHIYGVIFINNSEPFVSLLSRQTAINAGCTQITDV